MRGARGAVLAAGLLAGVLVSACGGNDGSPSADASEPADGAVVVTFQVADDQTYRVLLTDPADIDNARRLQAGEDVPSIPNGRVIRDETGVNEGYSWSIDPEDIEFADVTIEICDGVPSDVEAGIVSGDRYCPWSATVVGIEPAS